jgi:hypothetical protein
MFVQMMEGRTSDPEGLQRQLDRWVAELEPGAAGYVGTTGGVTSDGRVVMFARFESEDAARANSDRPEQGAWWADTEKCFDGPVTFTESSDIQSFLAGGSDDAGFVQVMKVANADRELAARLDSEFEKIAGDMRPDLIGGWRMWTGPDSAVDVNYFTSEAAARDGESKPPPPELAELFGEFMETMSNAEFIDLSSPMLHSAG